jgi:endonuclease/exonuclease/phosphatase family metal-dependent hydrolase
MAGSILRSITKKFFILCTVITAVLFLVACLSAYLNPATWWPIGFLGLMVPYLVVLLIFAVFFWLIVRAKYALLPLVALAIGYNQIRALFAFNMKAKFVAAKPANSIRIITWNVGNFVGISKNVEKKKHNREEVADAIIKMNADVLCLQEFNHSRTQGEQANNIGLFTEKYPYYYFSRDVDKNDGFYEYGSIIFSKYPLLDSGRVIYEGAVPESLAFADIKKDNDTFRVYTTHLQSFRFNQKDYSGIEKIKKQDDEKLAASKNLFRKMKYAFTRRGRQAELVHKSMEATPYPALICGDFNDVPNSFTYFRVRGLYQDAFLKKGFGIGRTFIALAPTLRIDYILAHPAFNILQFEMVDEDLSDHVMLVSDVSLKK